MNNFLIFVITQFLLILYKKMTQIDELLILTMTQIILELLIELIVNFYDDTIFINFILENDTNR